MTDVNIDRIEKGYSDTFNLCHYRIPPVIIVEIVMLEKLDCILSKSATRPYIYMSTSVNACIRIYV